MKIRRITIATLSLLLMIVALLTSGCGRVGRFAARRASGESAALFTRRSSKLLKKDLRRDSRTPMSRLQRERSVFRYTTESRAKQELAGGIGPGSHFTSKAKRGRPLSPAQARRRYGLPQEPQVRETVRLSKGSSVRHNRALGGASGVGEITVTKPLPPTAIKKVLPLTRP